MLIKKRTDVLPEITVMPKIDRVKFSLPDKPRGYYDTLNGVPSSLKFVNEQSNEDLTKIKTKVKIFDPDYLNTVNAKRLDDLKGIDSRTEVVQDKVSDFLQRESRAASIKLH